MREAWQQDPGRRLTEMELLVEIQVEPRDCRDNDEGPGGKGRAAASIQAEVNRHTSQENTRMNHMNGPSGLRGTGRN